MATYFVNDGSIVNAWDSPALQVVNALVFIITISVNSIILGIWLKTIISVICHPEGKARWFCRLSLCLVYVTSFIFVLVNGLFQFGLGLLAPNMCSNAIILCVSAYASTKIFIYAFLLERAFVVTGMESHIKSKIWLVGAAIYLGGIPIVVFFILGRKSHHDMENLTCTVGLHMHTLALVAWDSVLNVYLSFAFVWPLFHNIRSERLRKLAKNSLIACIVSLVTSVVNITVLVTKGEAGWVCMSLCTVDVLINTLCLAALTSPAEETDTRTWQVHPQSRASQMLQSQIISGVKVETSTTVNYSSPRLPQIDALGIESMNMESEAKTARPPRISYYTSPSYSSERPSATQSVADLSV